MGATIIGGTVSPSAFLTTNSQSGSTYTLVLTDQNNTLIESSNATSCTITVPPNSSVPFAVGAQINILQTGAGQVTIAAGVGVTVNATPGLKFRAQWSSASLIKRSTDGWVLIGDLSV